MRRGLISWSREEMPVAALDSRITRLQTAMRTENIDALLVYTSFAQPSAVNWISNFTPYWSEALLVLLPEGGPMLLASLTRRVHPWIKEVSHIHEVVMAPRLGVGAVALLGERARAGARVGVVGLDSLPWAVAEPLVNAYPGDTLVDASAMFASVRQPADPEERALATKAAGMVDTALKAGPTGAQKVSDVAAAVEAFTRLAGAEEVLQRFAPDLGKSAVLQRMEGDAPLGKRYALEVSVAYKGSWVRASRSVAEDAPSSWMAAEEWFAAATAGLHTAANGKLALAAPGKLVGWTVEACIGLQPLNVILAQDRPQVMSLPAGSVAVFSVQLELDDGPWHRAVTVFMGDAATQTVVIGARP
ncbi:MAG: hypothetical protein JWQ72_1238 [Polaromonas sp.]|nr:hypothetical protein [Polaromonas sp.]